MIWLTWRQHRAEAGVGAALLVAAVAALVVIGQGAHHLARQLGMPGCTRSGGDCGSALEQLHRHYHWLPPVTGSLIAVPLLVGMFWAAPLVSREYESGTHRLVWTQSISRRRWISTKVAIIAAVVGGAAAVLGLVATWALDPLAPAFGTRFNSTWYDITGVVPVACMLFAFAAGVAASALTRRTIPAMATTLVVYAAARIPVHFFRRSLWPTVHHTATYPLSALLRDPDGDNPLPIGLSPNDWIISTVRLDPAGRPIGGLNNRGILINYCPSLPPRGEIGAGAVQACQARVNGLSMKDVSRYHPASQFWSIQLVESLLFVAIAAVVAAAAIVAVVRRRSI